MPKTLPVEKQQFTFDDEWKQAFQYDDTSFYLGGPERLKGDIDGTPQSTRAVDIVAFHETAGLLLLEAKDFRGFRIQNKHRLSDAEIVTEVLFKVRDTVAGIVGADRRRVTTFDSDALVTAIRRGKPLMVVLWLEADAAKNERIWKQQLDVMLQKMKEKMGWLEARFYILSHQTQNRLPGLTVTNLAGAAGHKAKK